MEQQTPMTAREKYAQRKQKYRMARIRFFSLSFLCILVVSGIITAAIEIPKKIQTEDQELAQEPANDATAELPEMLLNTQFGPEIDALTTQYTPLTATQLSLPENGRVDMAYFDDALFIGDSLTQGFQVYSSGISNAHYAAYVGAGPKQLMNGTVTNLKGETVTAIDEILSASPKKVYILLGSNTLTSLDDESFLKYYSDFLDYLSPQLPADTVYYLQALPPVTAEKTQADESYSLERILSLNESIAQLAYARSWHFLNLHAVLSDDQGMMRTEFITGNDGIHLNSVGYEAWKEYLVTHTAYSNISPYIAGSPYAPVVS